MNTPAKLVFIDSLDERNEDLLGTIYQQQNGSEWYWNTYNWDIAPKNKRVMFGAFHRYSNRCLETLDREYKQGKYAWYETATATLAYINGLKINDLNFGEKKWYNYITMRDFPDNEIWKRIIKSGKYDNCLFHPVRENL